MVSLGTGMCLNLQQAAQQAAQHGSARELEGRSDSDTVRTSDSKGEQVIARVGWRAFHAGLGWAAVWPTALPVYCIM
jgi:hypothetical protein